VRAAVWLQPHSLRRSFLGGLGPAVVGPWRGRGGLLVTGAAGGRGGRSGLALGTRGGRGGLPAGGLGGGLTGGLDGAAAAGGRGGGLTATAAVGSHPSSTVRPAGAGFCGGEGGEA
jgi:hypothetical protein